MFRILWILITISILISACAPATQSTPIPIIDTATPSPLPTATPTRIALPSATPTTSITPLPTIPTFTPTFDVSTIVTVTPAERARCPEPKSDLSISLPQKKEYIPDGDELNNEYIKPILEYLNEGGNPQSLLDELKTKYGSNKQMFGEFLDFTNDGVDEIVIRYPAFAIFLCQEKQYKIIYQKGLIASYKIYNDLNHNGSPEIVSNLNICSGTGCLSVDIQEWDGTEFYSIGKSSIEGPVGIGYEFIDLDRDGINELVIKGERPSFTRAAGTIPTRIKTIIYTWNGQSYIESRVQYESPEYRFQAIQDADREVLYGNFESAISLYQDAIFSNKLEWWSHERQNYLDDTYSQSFEPTPIIIPTPIPDLTEYPSLAAYAYYRIMLLHLVQGHESDATTVYNTLQEKFGNDQYGRPYVEMATAFWNAYQSTHKMYAGCAAAIQYAAEHPDILIPLGTGAIITAGKVTNTNQKTYVRSGKKLSAISDQLSAKNQELMADC
jgi:hypothetical protein